MFAERAKDEGFTEAGEEFWAECFAEFFEYAGFHDFESVFEVDRGVIFEADSCAFGEGVGTDIGSNDDHRMTEISSASFGIREEAILEDLEEDIRRVGMRLLDFIEEYDGMWFATNFFGEFAALAIADIAGGRADHLRDAVPFAEFAHVETDEGSIAPEELCGNRFCEEGFADAGWSEKEKGCDGAIGVADVGGGTDKGAGDRICRLFLSDDGSPEGFPYFREGEHAVIEREFLMGDTGRS